MTFTQIRDAVALCEYFCWLEQKVRVSSAGLMFLNITIEANAYALQSIL